MHANPTKHIEKRKLDSLKPHPRQNQNFDPHTDETIRSLAKDMQANGQLTPVEITADGTLIAGCGRVQAVRLLGWDEVAVWVRDDLKSDADVELRLIEDNDNRRQLTPLGKARLAKRRWELQGKSSKRGEGLLRDQLGKILDMSGRNLDRYLRVLEAPIEVQQALDRKQLPLVEAKKVAGLARDVQEKIAEQIRNGEPPREVVQQFSKEDRGWTHLPENAGADYLRPLRRWRLKMTPMLPDIVLRKIEAEELRKLKQVIDQLLAKTKPGKGKAAKAAPDPNFPEGMPIPDAEELKQVQAVFREVDGKRRAPSTIKTSPRTRKKKQ